GQGVGKDEATFGIRVENFDGSAGERGQDVAGTDGAAGGKVLHGGNDSHEVDRKLEEAGGEHGAEYGCASTHVHLHFIHFFGGFQGNPSGIEDHSLADERHRAGIIVAAAVFHHNEP